LNRLLTKTVAGEHRRGDLRPGLRRGTNFTRDGDSEFADFFRRAQEHSRKGGEEGKKLLKERIG
jgi:hypothetical protein